MRIVIGHFHLQTGGVTRVIHHAATALRDQGHQVLVIAGEPPQQPLPEEVAFAHVPTLAYEERRPPTGPEALAADMEQAARTRFGQPPDLWHMHNHSLGKNLAVPGALRALAARGRHLLLQPHDFAEDGRPALYARLLAEVGEGDAGVLSARLYPQAPHIHYAVLTDRDRAFLEAAGVPGERLHLLPNAVSVSRTPAGGSHPFGDRRLWLYPTRAIRRKNLGEFLLWAAIAPEGDQFAATQAPQNPAERPRYAKWVDLAMELGLPVEFALGDRVSDFGGLLSSAHALVTTSVAEGFGLAFLEPWLVGRPLAGRNLPEITRDFAAAGLDLSGLYERLEVPLEWLDAGRLRFAMEEALKDNSIAYGQDTSADDFERLWRHVVRGGRIDFGRLDEPAQEEVIRHLVLHPRDGSLLRPDLLSPVTDPARLAANRTVAQRNYSVAGYGRRLEAIYGTLSAASAATRIEAGDARALLARFLAPERLYLLRT